MLAEELIRSPYTTVQPTSVIGCDGYVKKALAEAEG